MSGYVGNVLPGVNVGIGVDIQKGLNVLIGMNF